MAKAQAIGPSFCFVFQDSDSDLDQKYISQDTVCHMGAGIAGSGFICYATTSAPFNSP